MLRRDTRHGAKEKQATRHDECELGWYVEGKKELGMKIPFYTSLREALASEPSWESER
jgi:hypothetical protein